MKKRLLLISLMLLVTVSFAKMEIPNPTSNFFVNDFANVISASDEQEIFNMAKNLYESSGNSTQVVVVTIKSLDGYSIEEYANELFNNWGIGSKDKNDKGRKTAAGRYYPCRLFDTAAMRGVFYNDLVFDQL